MAISDYLRFSSQPIVFENFRQLLSLLEVGRIIDEFGPFNPLRTRNSSEASIAVSSLGPSKFALASDIEDYGLLMGSDFICRR